MPEQHAKHRGGETERPRPARGTSSRSKTSATPSVETDWSGHITRSSATPAHSTSTVQPFYQTPQSQRGAHEEAPTNATKIAIPRLKRSADAAADASTRSGGRHRVSHACEPCRHRKTKCSGERPICRHCSDFKIACYYADGKRDRVKKQFGTMSEKVADYEKLLKDLLNKVPENEARLIKASLDKAAQSELDEVATDSLTLQLEETDQYDEAGGAESDVSGGAGSTGALDRTEEDFTSEGARMTGFMGKNSDVTWLQRLKIENHYGDEIAAGKEETASRTSRKRVDSTQGGDEINSGVPLPEAVDGFAIQDSSYYLDDLAVTTFDAVDPFELPTTDTARTLFDIYMRRVYPTFPMVGKVNLTAQFRRFIANPVQRPPEKWLAILNMIFAISARYSHLVQAEWRGDERDHIIYFTRARLLSITHDTLFDHPDLQMIQVLGLMTLYMLCTGQMNRAWTLAGMSIRGGTALGLNMRNDSTNLKDSLKEIRYRLWWTLYSIEHRLSSMTGRVNCIVDEHCTTPLPVPLDEEQFESEEGKILLNKDSQQGNRAPAYNPRSPKSLNSVTPDKRSMSAKSGSSKSERSRSPSASQSAKGELEWAKAAPPSSALYFLHNVQLIRITQSIVHQLYNPSAVQGTWSSVQLRIRELNECLDNWYRNLPPILDFRRRQRDREFYEFRLNLGFFYYGTKQLVNRPCLCRLDRKIPGQSTQSNEFNRTTAATCVEAAQEMLRLIPDVPNAVGLIRVGPWWNILHWLMQSATVLMLEVSFRAHHMPEDADAIVESSKKAVRWLHALGEDNLSAKRAWSMCSTMLQQAVVKIGREVNDLPDKPPGRSDVSAEQNGASWHPSMNSYQPTQSMNADIYHDNPQMPTHMAYADYDTLMQYDQYFPETGLQNFPMSDHSSRMYQNTANDGDIDFMSNVYHTAGHH